MSLTTVEIEEIAKDITGVEQKHGTNDRYVIAHKELLATHHLYRRSTTEVENTLEDIMNSNVGRCIFFKDFPDKKECQCKGELLVTDNFITSIRKSAAEHCKSRNDPESDEFCMGPWGEGYDVVECADGMTEEGYDRTSYYYTVSQTENEAIIMMLFRKPLYPGSLYILAESVAWLRKTVSGSWMLLIVVRDGISCLLGRNK